MKDPGLKTTATLLTPEDSRIGMNENETNNPLERKSGIEQPAVKNYKEIYKRIRKANWFRQAYHNMSVGDIMEIQ